MLAQVSLTDKVVAANLYMLIRLTGRTALALVQLAEVGGRVPTQVVWQADGHSR